jgi:long-subunit acyl-CoA synthetase (AMP-forming)
MHQDCVSYGVPKLILELQVSPMNSSYTPHEVSHQFKNCRAKAIIVHPNLLPTLLEGLEGAGVSAEEARRSIVLGTWLEKYDNVPAGYTLLDDLLQVGELQQEEPFNGRYADETTLLCYSSGTTGLAKGVETTHLNLVAIMCMFPTVFIDTVPGKDKMLGFLPGYHIYG